MRHAPPQDQDDQTEAIRFLESGGGLGPEAERIDTHGAIIFLIGESALKMKRAVRYEYMDLSTMEKRRALLERELELNREAAPSIYRAVIPVTREPGGALHLGGEGEVLEWALSMRRFPAEAELTHIARARGVDDALARDLGAAVARYHRRAPVKDLDGADLISEIIDQLSHAFAEMTEIFQGEAEPFITRARAAFSAQADLLRARRRDGFVRRCHGDLHLGNIVVLDGAPTLFDALEFDERLGTCDTLYDLAFLLMDLSHQGFGHPANLVLNAYLTETSADMSDAGLAALPLYLSLRAAIRAMVGVQKSAVSPDEGAALRVARAYLRRALEYLAPPAPALIAIGGLSGSGKTTIARAIAHRIGPAPGAVHLRSDVARKKMMNLDPMERLGAEGYSAEATAKTYDLIRRQAGHVLEQGHAAILDAVHAHPEERAAAERVARAAGRRFIGIWLETPTATRRDRVTTRAPGASDADADIVDQQARFDLGPLDWRRIDADQPMEAVIAEIVRMVNDSA